MNDLPSEQRGMSENKSTDKGLTVIAVLLALLLIAVCGIGWINRPLPDSWVYMVAVPRDAELLNQLDKYGADGWELVYARRASDGDRYSPTMSYEVILKKRGTAPVIVPAKK
jgi:hypothetical protein